MSKYNFNARKFFTDLDGVAADFGSARDASGLSSEEFKLLPGSYRNLKPYPGVKEHLLELIERGFDVWVATKIPHKNPRAAMEKLEWILDYFPFLEKSVIITPNKGTLGGRQDFLIDDRPHKAHCEEFEGKLYRFGSYNEWLTWDDVMMDMSKRQPDYDILYDIDVPGGVVVPVRRIVANRKDAAGFVRYADVPMQLELLIHDELARRCSHRLVADTLIPVEVFQKVLHDQRHVI